jgi:hypothetical protein
MEKQKKINRYAEKKAAAAPKILMIMFYGKNG